MAKEKPIKLDFILQIIVKILRRREQVCFYTLGPGISLVGIYGVDTFHSITWQLIDRKLTDTIINS